MYVKYVVIYTCEWDFARNGVAGMGSARMERVANRVIRENKESDFHSRIADRDPGIRSVYSPVHRRQRLEGRRVVQEVALTRKSSELKCPELYGCLSRDPQCCHSPELIVGLKERQFRLYSRLGHPI